MQINGTALIIYDIPAGREYGATYFLKDIALDNDGSVYHIAYPELPRSDEAIYIDNVAVWKEDASSEFGT